MSIFIDQNTRLVVQGITGRDGSFHTRQMIEYGTKVVAGVTPGKGGQTFDDTVPIVIRLTGTNEELAVRILEDAGFSAMTDMDAAVERAVGLAKGAAQ